MSDLCNRNPSLFEEVIETLEDHYELEGLGCTILTDLNPQEMQSLMTRLAKQLRDKGHYESAKRMSGLAKKLGELRVDMDGYDWLKKHLLP